jgi:hypothetical protein
MQNMACRFFKLQVAGCFALSAIASATSAFCNRDESMMLIGVATGASMCGLLAGIVLIFLTEE